MVNPSSISSPVSTSPPPTVRKCSCKYCMLKFKPTVFMKIFQMISVVITFGLFRGMPLTFGSLSGDDPDDYVMTAADVFCSGVMVSQLIITPVLFICHYIAKLNITSSYLEPVIHIIFCIFSLISGFIGLSFWHSPPDDWKEKKSGGVVMFIFCFITAILYFVDIMVFLKFKLRKPRPTESNA